MKPEDKIKELLREIGRADRSWSAPPDVESRLLEQWDSSAEHLEVRTGTTRRRLWIGGLASAAAVVALFVFRQVAPLPPGSIDHIDSRRSPVAAGTQPTSFLNADDFIPLVADGGMAPVQWARIRMPRAALSAFGIPAGETSGGQIDAEVLIGEDAVAYAIRLVRSSR